LALFILLKAPTFQKGWRLGSNLGNLHERSVKAFLIFLDNKKFGFFTENNP